MPRSTRAAAEGMPKSKVLPFPADGDGALIEHRQTELTGALADAERMASILSTLLQERIIDTGTGSTLAVGREDAEDIRFAGQQLMAMLARAGDIWRAIP